VAADLDRIRAALAQHAPWIEFVDSHDAVEFDDDDDVLEPPPRVDDPSVLSDLTLYGHHLGYRIAALSDGSFAVIGRQLDGQERPRVLLRNEVRWKTVVWFVWLLETNRVTSVRLHGLDLRDRHGRIALSIA
jgi:hypothetical protein